MSNAIISSYVTYLTGGSYIKTWSTLEGVFFQKYSSSDVAIGSANKLVNTTNISCVSVTGLKNGNYVAVWTAYDSKGNPTGVYSQVYNAAGVKVGTEVRVTTDIKDVTDLPIVKTMEDGSYTVSWKKTVNGVESYKEVKYTEDSKLIKAIGSNKTYEYNVTNTSNIEEGRSEVATLKDGGYVVVYAGKDSSGSGIFSQKFDSLGNKVGGAILVNTIKIDNQWEAKVTSLANGKYLVTWTDFSTGPSSGYTSLKAQIMNADQTKFGGEFEVSKETLTRLYDPIIGLEDGGFIVTWTSNFDSSSNILSVYGKRYDASGKELQTFKINEGRVGNNTDTEVSYKDGKLLVTWTAKDSSGTGIYSKEFTVTDKEVIAPVPTINTFENFGSGANGWLKKSGTTNIFLDAIVENIGTEKVLRGENNLTFVKAYDFGIANANKTVSIKLDLYELDSWEGESFKALINGIEVFSKSLSSSNNIENILGSNTSYKDEKHLIQFNAKTDANGKLKVEFTSSLNEAKTNESFAIDNIEIISVEDKLVNTKTANDQNDSTITHLVDGSYVVSWASYNGLFFQKFDVSGKALGIEQKINTKIVPTNSDCTLTALKNGGFVAVWTSNGGNERDIAMQRFDANGNKVGLEEVVNDTTSGTQYLPSVSVFDDGSFIISWTGYEPVSKKTDVYTKRFSEATDINVTDTRITFEDNSNVTSLKDGGYVIVWKGADSSGSGVYSQKFDSLGNKIGVATLINTVQSGYQTLPDVCTLSDGRYLVTWKESNNALNAQIMNADQTKSASVFNICNTTKNSSIVGLDDGGFVVTYTLSTNIIVKRYDESGKEIENFIANTDRPSLDTDSVDVSYKDGKLLVSWSSKDTDNGGIYSKEFKIGGGLLATENFENGTNGWTGGSLLYSQVVPATDSVTNMLRASSGEVLSKTFDFGMQNAGKTVSIKFDLYELDSWDGEAFQVKINGSEVLSKHLWMDESYGEKDGGTSVNISGTDTLYKDEKYANVTVSGKVDANGKLKLEFTSTLNEDKDNESFGIDNIQVSTTQILAPIPKINAVDNFENGSNGWLKKVDGTITDATVSNLDSKIGGILGAVGRDASNKLETLGKLYDFGVENANKEVVIKFDLYELDSWDGEYFKAYVNSSEIFSKNLNFSGNTLNIVGSNTNVKDEKHSIQFVAKTDENGKLNLEISSTLNEAKSNESFAIDNVSITSFEDKLLNTQQKYNQSQSSITYLEDGSYVASYRVNGTGINEVRIQKFLADGTKVGSESVVDGNFAHSPEIVALKNGGYLVTWTSDNEANSTTTSDSGVYMLRFDSNGNKQTLLDEKIADITEGNQTQPSVSVLNDGSYVVSWTGYNPNTSTTDIYTQRFNENGTKYSNKVYDLGQNETIDISKLKVADILDTNNSKADNIKINMNDILDTDSISQKDYVIKGEKGDLIDLNSSEWTKQATKQTIDNVSYNVYRGSSSAGIRLLVEDEITTDL